jgi:hypothetical protein
MCVFHPNLCLIRGRGVFVWTRVADGHLLPERVLHDAMLVTITQREELAVAV